MALTGQLEAEVELKVPADKFFCVLKSENHRIPNAASDKEHSVEVHEGDWETHGSIKLWKYTIGMFETINLLRGADPYNFAMFYSESNTEGKTEVFKEKILVDDANKCVTYVGLEGHVMEEYFKSYKHTYRITPDQNDESSCVVKITMEYDKLNQNVPDPNKYLQFLVNLTKDIEGHLLKGP